ncbi:GNAT family N-acetyltransferase [Streptomyces tsukubensis]|uniref:GNAT family N-acetyltransferase n=1 Tax=Streptomyces tsukubensis TaxID=83656 RepID=A0A1V4AEW8_9ACTN|nr:GNAT family N-acetyltransferase [Streptomyces tsukubensis]OON82153.1 GNAT family N-acetyltransferase [Streptomyces tsukubensis]QFR92637.1 GNAT family N-acetyltransferase [Streptomyces tsukubensis]
MTTTLRPTGPLQYAEDGTRTRQYQVCVNSRPVGTADLATHPVFGPSVGRITDLRIDEGERGRGRATVAALAAEEIFRDWRCGRIETTVPAEAFAALRLAEALGYTERNRHLAKTLTAGAPALPEGSLSRRMTPEEYGPWLAAGKEGYAKSWIDRGVPESEARAKSEADHARDLPDGLDSPGMSLTVLEHEGVPVGDLFISVRPEDAYILNIEVRPEFRGRGHGRTLMLAAESVAVSAGRDTIALNVFSGNTPAIRLYASLGYLPTAHYLYKSLS